MDELGLWGTVRKMREMYGMFAALTASQRARKALQSGDMARHDRWSRIAEILGQTKTAPEGAASVSI